MHEWVVIDRKASIFFDKRFQKYNFSFNSPPKEQEKKSDWKYANK